MVEHPTKSGAESDSNNPPTEISLPTLNFVKQLSEELENRFPAESVALCENQVSTETIQTECSVEYLLWQWKDNSTSLGSGTEPGRMEIPNKQSGLFEAKLLDDVYIQTTLTRYEMKPALHMATIAFTPKPVEFVLTKFRIVPYQEEVSQTLKVPVLKQRTSTDIDGRIVTKQIVSEEIRTVSSMQTRLGLVQEQLMSSKTTFEPVVVSRLVEGPVRIDGRPFVTTAKGSPQANVPFFSLNSIRASNGLNSAHMYFDLFNPSLIDFTK